MNGSSRIVNINSDVFLLQCLTLLLKWAFGPHYSLTQGYDVPVMQTALHHILNAGLSRLVAFQVL